MAAVAERREPVTLQELEEIKASWEEDTKACKIQVVLGLVMVIAMHILPMLPRACKNAACSCVVKWKCLFLVGHAAALTFLALAILDIFKSHDLLQEMLRGARSLEGRVVVEGRIGQLE